MDYGRFNVEKMRKTAKIKLKKQAFITRVVRARTTLLNLEKAKIKSDS
jgi:hypothetical protein